MTTGSAFPVAHLAAHPYITQEFILLEQRDDM
jgi:hypothetical protein